MVNALTITTFNILAPVHRSMPNQPNPDLNQRESEREDWWRPRAEGVAQYIAEKFATSDVVLLQEWWFDESFTSVFDTAIGDTFERVAERRPGSAVGQDRDDGMCCLVRKNGLLEIVKSEKVLTGPQRIAQIVHLQERNINEGQGGVGRTVFIANTHLSFPGDDNPEVNNQRQANEAKIILDALSKARNECWDTTLSFSKEDICLEIVCGDFNSNSCSRAAAYVESKNFVNCVSATANQLLANVGGPVNIGTTHCDHLGNRVSVDHIFLRLAKLNDKDKNERVKQERCSALALGYLDTHGTRVLAVQRDKIVIDGSTVLSDHRPVTAKIAWPRRIHKTDEKLSDLYVNVTMPLDPLEPAWGIVQDVQDDIIT